MSDFIDRDLNNLYSIHRLDDYMQGHNGFIAGGCFKSILTNTHIKDVDVFFENEADWQEACEYYESHDAYKFSYKNDKVQAFKNIETNVRVELIKYIFGAPEEIISKFDFTVTKFAYYKSTHNDTTEYRVVHHRDYFEHLQMKRLVIDAGMVKPISTFERSYKYRDYGFRMCRESKVKLLTAIKLTEFTDADLVQSLYDGMD